MDSLGGSDNIASVSIGEEPASQAARDFRTTHWSLVLEAGACTDGGRGALETLCRHYWYPLYAFVRRRGYPPAEAQDLTQEFFARLLASESLSDVSPEKGRFRTFLLAALKHFLAKEWRDANRLKRGGGRDILAWDGLDPEARFLVEPVSDAAPETQFDRRWAQTLVNGVLARLAIEQAREGLAERFTGLKAFLQGDGPGESYGDVARRLGLSESAAKSAIFRLRRRYGELIRDEIAQTVAGPDEVQAEIRHLIAVLAG